LPRKWDEVMQVVEHAREGQILISIPGIGPLQAAIPTALIGNIVNFDRIVAIPQSPSSECFYTSLPSSWLMVALFATPKINSLLDRIDIAACVILCRRSVSHNDGVNSC
jgi:hypothetical protein